MLLRNSFIFVFGEGFRVCSSNVLSVSPLIEVLKHGILRCGKFLMSIVLAQNMAHALDLNEFYDLLLDLQSFKIFYVDFNLLNYEYFSYL